MSEIYVECIEGFDNDPNYGEVGVIYSVAPTARATWLLGDCSVSKNRFKPSTKEAYDIQELKKQAWWIRVTKENQKVLSEWRGADVSIGYVVSWNYGKISNMLYKGHNPQPVNDDDFYYGNEITIDEFYAKTGVIKQEPTFPVVGQEYEFSDDEVTWEKDTLTCFIVGRKGRNTRYIRPIQAPKYTEEEIQKAKEIMKYLENK